MKEEYSTKYRYSMKDKDNLRKPLLDSYGRTGKEFLEEQFEDHYCDSCSKDKEDHTAVPLGFGTPERFGIIWFARCDSLELEDD